MLELLYSCEIPDFSLRIPHSDPGSAPEMFSFPVVYPERVGLSQVHGAMYLLHWDSAGLRETSIAGVFL
jgi:hypothetical protein